MFPIKTMTMKQITTLLTLAALLVAGQAIHTQAPVAMGADVPEFLQLLEKRKTDPNTPINMQGKQLQNAYQDLFKGKERYVTAGPTGSIGSLDLERANFQNANLTNFLTSSVKSTDTMQAWLSDANLSGANLAGADLSYAALYKANLTGANLSKVNFSGANFEESTGFTSTILDNGTNFQDAFGLTPEQKAYARSKGAQNVPN